ncbi:MAG: enoyl-CoA hydratase/isomerase family protein [Desulfomonilaceae bacterium]
MSEGDLLYQVKQGAAWMIINRETRGNAINLEIINQFTQSLDLAEADEEVRVVCITGSGDRVFCSGADLATSFSGQDYVDGARKYATLLKKMAAFPKPLVARVNGNCLAGGLGLMLSCDMVYARDGAKFGTPEVNVGLFPMMIGALIFRNCLRKKALEMIYTGNMISAVEAENMGLITRALSPEQFKSAVEEKLAAIASKAPLAIKIGKPALAFAEDRDLESALDYLCLRLGDVIETEDAKEGLTAFMQKRKPVWKGR